MVSARVASLIAIAAVAGAAVLWFSPAARTTVAAWTSTKQAVSPKKTADSARGPEGTIKLTADQITKAKIETAEVTGCSIVQQIKAPGAVTLDADRVGRIAAKVVGTVAELRKRLGDPVAKGEVVAVLESREVADTRSDYLAAAFHFDLQKTLFEREQLLYDRKISAEQQYLRARNAFLEAELRVNIARQKLVALGLGDDEIARLSTHQTAGLRQFEVRAPLAGQVIERRVDLGAPVGREGQENEIYVVADLSTLWVELSVSMADLAAIARGQSAVITTSSTDLRAEGKIIFVSPMLHAETRSARVVVALDNASMTWRPGIFVSALIKVAGQPVDLCVRRSALQTVEGEQVLFVRTEAGFEKREVVVGRGDEQSVEIVFGLDPGEVIATSNTFVLKAELSKGEAGHDHDH